MRALWAALLAAETAALAWFSLVPYFLAPGVPAPGPSATLLHALAYAVYAVLWSKALPALRLRALLSWLLPVFAGIALELLQAGVPNRAADPFDALANAAGAALGLAALHAISASRARPAA